MKPEFIEMMRALLGSEAGAFEKAMEEAPTVSIKLNRRKSDDVADAGYGDLEPVKWCRSGYYLAERPRFTSNPLLHAGVFYVQDASSMVYETVMERIVPMALDTGHPPVVLDLCAAPGGKTTSIINALPDGSLVVANEYVKSRAAILRENLIKWGYPEIVVTNSPTSSLARIGAAFDIVAVDAPCSGEGMMRKDDTAVEQWSPGLIRQCVALQREILADAVKMLKPGGFMIYSTCTFNREEDEEQVAWLAGEQGMVPFDLDLPEEWSIGRGTDTIMPCYRFMPHLTRGEGLFLAVMRKEEDVQERVVNRSALLAKIDKAAKVICRGIPQCVEKGKLRIPESVSVLATDYVRGAYPEAELDEASAISYLKHESICLPQETPRGYVAVTYKGHPLGLVKNLGNRANNMYPPEWRIRH